MGRGGEVQILLALGSSVRLYTASSTSEDPSGWEGQRKMPSSVVLTTVVQDKDMLNSWQNVSNTSFAPSLSTREVAMQTVLNSILLEEYLTLEEIELLDRSDRAHELKGEMHTEDNLLPETLSFGGVADGIDMTGSLHECEKNIMLSEESLTFEEIEWLKNRSDRAEEMQTEENLLPATLSFGKLADEIDMTGSLHECEKRRENDQDISLPDIMGIKSAREGISLGGADCQQKRIHRHSKTAVLSLR